MSGISAEEKAARAAKAAENEATAPKSEIEDLKAQIEALKQMISVQAAAVAITPVASIPAPLPESKKVPIMLFKDNDRYKDDLFVGVNGENFQIQRGVEVMVPDYVKEVIDRSYYHDIDTMKKQQDMSEKYEKTLK